MNRRIVVLLIALVICVFLCSCKPLFPLDTISYNDDITEMYYHGHTYINYNNYNGNDAENPDFITNSRTFDFYVREDLTFDHNTELSLCATESSFLFRISEITNENVIEFAYDQKVQFTELCNFYVTIAEYPSVKLWITISEHGGKLYLQDVWNSDYYEITDAFEEDIYRLGLNTLD